jgi:hypothetical protein
MDLLANSPSWTTCFYIAAPVFSIVMLSVFILKHRSWLESKLTECFQQIQGKMKNRASNRFNKKKIADKENQYHFNPEDPEHLPFTKAAEEGDFRI